MPDPKLRFAQRGFRRRRFRGQGGVLQRLALAARSVQRAADFAGFVALLGAAVLLSRFGTKVAVTFCVDAKKKCIVALEAGNPIIFGGRIHKRRSGREVLPAACGRFVWRLLKQCKAHGVRLYVWGYADKQFFGFSFSDCAKTSRL